MRRSGLAARHTWHGGGLLWHPASPHPGHARPRGRDEAPREGAVELAAKIMTLAIAYFATARFGLTLASTSFASAVWPATGVAVAGLALFGVRAWPGVAIGGFLASLSCCGTAAAAAATVAQVSAPVAAAALLKAWDFDSALDKLRDVLALIVLAGAVSMTLSATIGTVALLARGVVTTADWPLVWLSWWIGDAMGIIVVAPLLLTVGAAARSRAHPFRRHTAEAVVLLVATAFAARVFFSGSLPLAFLIFPFSLWAALRFALLGAAAVNVLVTGVTVWTTVHGYGPFAQMPPTKTLVFLQSFNASVAITSLVLAAVTQERRRALEEVRASRARIVEAADAERRRVERNLHDGAQQRLVSLSLSLRLAEMQLESSPNPELRTTLTEASAELQRALAELRELARGLHPSILTQQGLCAAVESLAEQAPLPVNVVIPPQRYPAAVETTAYFVVCEALANVARHARASAVTVSVQHVEGKLIVEIVDDGVGGANPTSGSGLSGLADRVAALDGRLQITSPPGQGTRVRAEMPCG